MCLIVDTCCLAQVFDRHNSQHHEFTPVLNWITIGRGRLIYGGTKYATELRRAAKFIKIVAELNRSGRAIQVPTGKVDKIGRELKAAVNDPKFNDEHLIALVIVSRCHIVCTNDNIAIVFLKRRDLYITYRAKRPKIYRGRRNASLCCDGNVIDVRG